MTLQKPAPKTNAPNRTENNLLTQAMPLYIGILLLILGAIIGFGVRAAFFEAPVITPDQNNQNPTPLNVTVFTAPNCPSCNQTTSFELLLQKRGIAFTRITKDTADPQVKTEFDSLDANSLPVVSVDLVELQARDSALLTSLTNYGQNKNGQFILEELNLLPATQPINPVTIQLVSIPQTNACTSDKPTIIEYSDFLCEDCYNVLGQSVQLQKDFNTEIEYRFVPLTVLGQDNDSELVANSYLCAVDQNTGEQYKKSIFEQFFGLNFPSWDTERQMIAATQAKVPDLNQFATCLDQNKFSSQLNPRTGTNTQQADQFKINRLPTYVIDCQYLVIAPQDITKTLCELHPELTACGNQ